ncbi:hypothetical protein [Rugamonas rubra]|uniref:Uncharacterized protein n=1 Tax=Rugamonas rubra TaxID=758825 RepID=A0A1I4SGQ1_9BURK|nr:hypothetical protein [Rugamonas rubra]SFM63480.1 hypothetical protein SAMN02982985_04759 [Rugamonas rubra]
MTTVIDALPPAPSTDDPDNFDPAGDALLAALPTMVTQQNLANAEVSAAAAATAASAALATLRASDAASSAAAAASASAATKWDAVTIYADGAPVWSPTNRLPYRRIGAGSGGADPASNGAQWAIQLLGIGLGGVSLTGNVALTSTSPGAISVTPSQPGLYAILPDATSCVASAGRFAIYNAGDYDYGVKDYSGKQIGWIRAGSGATIGLVDNTTAGGIWVSAGLEKTGVTATLNAPGIRSNANNYARVALDATRTFILFGYYGATGGIYGVVYDSSSLTWGAPVLIRATASGILGAKALLSAANQVLVTSVDGVALEAVTITASGVGLTVNSGSKATATLGSALQDDGCGLIAVGSSWVIGYGQGSPATGAFLRAISVSGTTPTIGAASALNSGANGITPELYASGSIVRALAIAPGSGVNLTCYPFTVSGSTLTPGTSAVTMSLTSGAGRSYRKSHQSSNGNIICVTAEGGPYASVFKLTGTVEAGSLVGLGGSWLTTPFVGDVFPLSASKTFVAVSDGLGSYTANILTDAAGTATAGTPVVSSPSPTTIAKVALAGSIARIAVRSAAAVVQVGYDCSGASPSIVATTSTNRDVSLPEDGHRLTASDQVYGVGDAGRGWDGCFSANSCRLAKPLNISLLAGINGAANELWGLSNMPGLGSTIHRIEAAA